jgi:hypothetical protein
VTAAPAWVAELGLGRPAGWPAMGVRADPAPWPRPAPPELLAARRHLLAEHPECAGALPGAEAACVEVASLAGVHERASTTDSRGPMPRGPAGGADVLAAAAVAQGDDLCVLAPEPGWPLVAGVVLFPSHWRLADKLGRPLGEVHGPVPGYPAEQVDRFLDRLQPGQAVRRRNLLVHRDGELHAPDPTDDEVPVDRWWLRSERQTLRRLSRTGAVVFTIGTDTTPLADLDHVTRRALADRLAAFPPTWGPYAGVGDGLPELVSWLRG